MILVVYGTRPEYIKIKPLISEFDSQTIKYKILFTGQHKDIAPINSDFSIEMVEMSNNRLDSIIKNCLSLKDEYFDGIDYIIIQGDTSTALGLAITAFHRKIKIIHLEAGLRTFDFENPYPEEMNRQLISRISDINFCPTQNNYENLTNENVNGKSFVVGNTVLDNLVEYKKHCEYTNKVLVTLHRRENHSIISDWFTEINKLATINKHLEFILPVHPNPEVQKYKHLLKNVKIIEPLKHDELLKILVKSKIVISDSGGIQEECSFFNKKVLVCRTTTERPESLNFTSFLVERPEYLSEEFHKHIINYNVQFESPYGDGFSSKKIVKILKNEILFSQK